MEKTIELKPGETIAGLFKQLKNPGDIIHVKDVFGEKHLSMRNAALLENKVARAAKEVEPYQVKFRILRSLKKGYTSIEYKDHSKVEA